MRGASTQLDPGRPVPLVCYGDECAFTRNAMTALSQAGRDCELMFVGSSLVGLTAAVAAGFGVMALPRSKADIPGVTIWDDAPLPKLPDVFTGIYVRNGAEFDEHQKIADAIAGALRPGAPDHIVETRARLAASS